MKQSLFAKSFNGKLYLYCFTIPPLHWDALGARRLPCKVSVWTAWHTISSKWGIFLEVSSLYVFHLVMDLEIMILWCLEGKFNFFSAPATGFCIFCIFLCVWSYTYCKVFKHIQALPVFAVPDGPFYQCSTISLTSVSDTSQILSSLLSQITSDAGNSRGATPKKIFLPKKYLSIFPHPVFSPLSSRLLFLDCLTICCSECL